MFDRFERKAAIAAGAFVLAGMAAVVGLAVAALLAGAAGTERAGSVAFDAYIWRVTRFTLLQAALSTLLSVGLAVPLARALARRPRFFGRIWLLRLFAVPLGLPAIVAALGIVAVWGRQGFANDLLTALGREEPVSIYGLAGILVAHVFFNLPLAARLMLSAVERVPAEYWRNAAQLDLPSRRVFTLIEWPAMARVLPGVAGLVFMLCATSFTLVLLLGGGPAATTIEVAIYQSLRFDFDPPRAVMLALLQIVLTAAVLAVLALLPRTEEGTTGGGSPRRFDGHGLVSRTTDGVIIAAGALFVVAPMAATLASGLAADLGGLLAEPIVWRAAVTSFIIATVSALIALLMAGAIVVARQAAEAAARRRVAVRGFRTALSGASSLILLVPPVVLGAGWFLLLRGRVDVFAAAPFVVVAVNALMALPFVVRILEPAYATHVLRTGRLSASLGLQGMARWRRIDLPALGGVLATAGAFAMALSLGDLGAIALFGSQDLTTLPYLLYQRMGSYRTEDAAGLALLLGLVCLLLMIGGTRHVLSGEPRGAQKL